MVSSSELHGSEVAIDKAQSNKVIDYISVFYMTALLSGLVSVVHSTCPKQIACCHPSQCTGSTA